ncbi:transposase (plasmid) [Levilactobacillus brevis]|nr:transposase [Levilactobacillus brevis]
MGKRLILRYVNIVIASLSIILETFIDYGCPKFDQYDRMLKAIKQEVKDGLLMKENHQCSKNRNH